MKAIYTAPNREAAALALDHLEAVWGKKYGYAITSWRNNWEELIAFLAFPHRNQEDHLYHKYHRKPERKDQKIH